MRGGGVGKGTETKDGGVNGLLSAGRPVKMDRSGTLSQSTTYERVSLILPNLW